MSKESLNDLKYSRDDIIRNTKEAALTCYGVKDIMRVSHKKGNEEDAIYVHFDKENHFSLDVHVIVASGVKVTETIRSLRKTIRFYMNRLYPDSCLKINIYAEWISSN